MTAKKVHRNAVATLIGNMKVETRGSLYPAEGSRNGSRATKSTNLHKRRSQKQAIAAPDEGYAPKHESLFGIEEASRQSAAEYKSLRDLSELRTFALRGNADMKPIEEPSLGNSELGRSQQIEKHYVNCLKCREHPAHNYLTRL